MIAGGPDWRTLALLVLVITGFGIAGVTYVGVGAGMAVEGTITGNVSEDVEVDMTVYRDETIPLPDAVSVRLRHIEDLTVTVPETTDATPGNESSATYSVSINQPGEHVVTVRTPRTDRYGAIPQSLDDHDLEAMPIDPVVSQRTVEIRQGERGEQHWVLRNATLLEMGELPDDAERERDDGFNQTEIIEGGNETEMGTIGLPDGTWIVFVVLSIVGLLIVQFVRASSSAVPGEEHLDPEEDSTESSSDPAETPAPRPTAQAAAFENDVYRAWYELVRRLELQQNKTMTPREVERHAIDAGLSAHAVDHLRRAFIDVRYGGCDPTDYAGRARTALEQIEADIEEESP